MGSLLLGGDRSVTSLPCVLPSPQGLQFEVVPSRFRETLDKAAFPSAAVYAEETAKHKALEVATRMHQA